MDDRLHLLPDEVTISPDIQNKILEDYLYYAKNGLPKDIEQLILEKYRVDVSGEYAGKKIRNPFGKASGQLSMNINQVKADVDCGLGFVVLKTVVSEDGNSNADMVDWSITAPRMLIEEITSASGRKGYTITWKGRGWDKSFEAYLNFMEESISYAKNSNTLVIPSCIYALPTLGEPYKESEYDYTTKKLYEVWNKVMGDTPFIMEKDFSPTLSGSDRSKNSDMILNWVENVPKLIKKYGPNDMKLGIKLMNALFDDEFQVKMLEEALSKNSGIDYIIAFNRLFNPNKEFDGKTGVAYGGYDLSDRNLRVLDSYLKRVYNGEIEDQNGHISATGNICSGKMMAEYALRGCSSGQMHTYYQIPAKNYGMQCGYRTCKALLELLLNPKTGLVASLIYLKEKYGINSESDIISFKDIYTLHLKENIFKMIL